MRDHGYGTATVVKIHFGGPDQHLGFQHRPYGGLLGEGDQSDPIGIAPRQPLLPVGTHRNCGGGYAGVDRQPAGYRVPPQLRPQRAFLPAPVIQPAAPPLRPLQRYWNRYYPERADLPDRGPNFPNRFHSYVEHQRNRYRFDRLSKRDFRAARAVYYSASVLWMTKSPRFCTLWTNSACAMTRSLSNGRVTAR